MEFVVILVMIILSIKHFFGGGITGGMGIIYGFSILGSIWAFISLKDKNFSFKSKQNEIKWKRVLDKNSFVQEIVNEINSNYIRRIQIYQGYIKIGEKIINYSEKNLSSFL